MGGGVYTHTHIYIYIHIYMHMFGYYHAGRPLVFFRC